MWVLVPLDVEVVGEFVKLAVVDLLEGYEKGRHHSGFVLVLGDCVVLGVVELEVYNLVGHLCVPRSHVVKYIKTLHVLLELLTPPVRRHKMHIAFSLLLPKSFPKLH